MDGEWVSVRAGWTRHDVICMSPSGKYLFSQTSDVQTIKHVLLTPEGLEINSLKYKTRRLLRDNC